MTSVFIISIRLVIVQIVGRILVVTLGTLKAGRHLLRRHREPGQRGRYSGAWRMIDPIANLCELAGSGVSKDSAEQFTAARRTSHCVSR